jgi:hypothetical protein
MKPMHAGKYIAVVLIIAISSLSILSYCLLSPNSFAAVSKKPPAASSTLTPKPTPVYTPSPTPVSTSKPIPTPSTPEFTVKFVNTSIDTAATYKVDEFTGEQVLDKAAQHYVNQSIQITITNQPFTPFLANDKQIELYYNVSWKGHFGDEWRYSTFNYVSSGQEYTVISIMPKTQGISRINNEESWIGEVTAGDYDFKVQAFIGYWTQVHEISLPISSYYEVWTGQTSNWSSIQTITVP